MRNAQRILALGAMTLTAGAVLGMTATAANASTGQGGAQATAAQPNPHDHDHDGKGDGGWDGKRDGDWDGKRDGDWDRRGGHVRTWIAGRYDSRRTCEFFAWVGEHRGRFDDGRCVPGFNRGHHSWLLIARDYGRKHR